MTVQRERAERAVRELLIALGHDPAQNPELRDTPGRVVDAFTQDLLCGYDVDLDALLEKGRCGTGGASGTVVAVQDIFVTTLCPHHLMPASGYASIAYLPGPSLIGLGTLSALVNACARRLTLQESIGERVVAALVEKVQVRGAYCRLVLTHSCLSARGERQSAAKVSSLALRGELTLEQVTLALGTRADG